MIREFASLHNHSHFSVLDGLSLPQEMVQAAKDRGLRSLAITDHGHAHAHADIHLHAKRIGQRVIFGVEAYVIDSLEEWKRLKEAKDESDEEATNLAGQVKQAGRKGHLILLACNREGLSNLYRLIYRAHKEGYYGKPRMDKIMLREHSRGLVGSSACMGGVVSNKVWAHSRGECGWEDVVREARDLDAIFGRGRFFLELQLNESANQRTINEALLRIHEETGIPLTVTTDSHYISHDDWAAQELLYMLRDKVTLATRPKDWSFEIRQLYIKSPEEMWQSYERFGRSHVPERTMLEAFQNTLLIDSLVEDFEPDTHQRLPTLKDVEDPFRTMGELAIAELKRRGLDRDERYSRQLLHELKVIKDKGLANYFMIMRRMIHEARKEMLVGAGRGSAAGSLVCYMLGVTDLDPLKHGLMFERFLDPERKELPDIDTDFEDPDRVKEILREIFGEDNVACLSSYSTFQIKGLMKDVARVYDLDHAEINRLNKKIEAELRVLYANQDKSTIVIKLEDIERVSPTFNDFCDHYPEPARYFKRLYGRNRHVGRHAAGVIIGDDLPSETALFKSRDKGTGELVTQTSFTEGIVNKNVSAMGFVKFDILGLTNLKVIHHALDLLAAKTGEPYEVWAERIRPHNMDLDDMKVLKHVFWDGNFAGIFTFTNKGIRKVARSIKPDSFEDIVAISALYRPGPLGSGMHKLYASNKRKAKEGKLTFEHPVLEEIMRGTYGCLIYQEQMLQLGSKMGRLDGRDTQRLRKLFLKKDKSKADAFIAQEEKELKEKFLKGCEQNSWPRGEETWEMMSKFGGYGFNKSHSAAYSVCTMQTAWLATYHPLEFYSALLTRGEAGEMQDYVGDIKKAGVKVLPVDVNESRGEHTVQERAIRLSLRTVKGVGPKVIEKIVAGQPYADFFDFVRRSGASKTAVGPLVAVGAFDRLHKNMRQVEQWYELFQTDPKFKTKKWDEFISKCKGIVADDYEIHDKVALENALMGFSTRGSPFEILNRQKKIDAVFEGTVMSYQEFVGGTAEIAMIPVVVKDWKERPQRNKKMFAFVKFGTEDGQEFEAPAFANIWCHIGPRLRKGSVYIVTFNRKPDEPENLVVGRPGFAQSAHSAETSVIDIDEITL